ncbi:MAG: DUF370 domain-containing protein [Clostridiales bacterium]|nr:DUF370 domain-containing protein [Clostridiales bacterium]
MLVHLSKNETVLKGEIVGIFDIERSTLSQDTRNFLKQMQNDLKTVSLCDDIPKAFVLCDNIYTDRVYITQISPESLVKRANKSLSDQEQE